MKFVTFKFQVPEKNVSLNFQVHVSPHQKPKADAKPMQRKAGSCETSEDFSIQEIFLRTSRLRRSGDKRPQRKRGIVVDQVSISFLMQNFYLENKLKYSNFVM